MITQLYGDQIELFSAFWLDQCDIAWDFDERDMIAHKWLVIAQSEPGTAKIINLFT